MITEWAAVSELIVSNPRTGAVDKNKVVIPSTHEGGGRASSPVVLLDQLHLRADQIG